MHDSRVAKRYANAMFNVAKAHDMVKSVEDDLNGISSLLENDPQFSDFMLSPFVGGKDKIEISEKLFSDRITALSMATLRVILEKRRENEITAIRDEFVALRRSSENVLFVTVTTAEQLENDQRAALEMKLAKVVGTTIEATYEIEPHLIGGIRVSYDNVVLDGSVKGNLRKLRENIRRDVLKQN